MIMVDQIKILKKEKANDFDFTFGQLQTLGAKLLREEKLEEGLLYCIYTVNQLDFMTISH